LAALALAIVVALVASVGAGSTYSESLVGDASCDGIVNSIDTALVLQFDARLIFLLACQQNADVNQDGEINSLDAALILQYDAGLTDSLPPPAPLPPASPTPKPTPTSTPRPTRTPPPPPTPTPSPLLLPQEVILMAVDWFNRMLDEENPSLPWYFLGSSLSFCEATWSGQFWIVRCRVSGPAVSGHINICVYETTLTVGLCP
jgi:hypothetical protein